LYPDLNVVEIAVLDMGQKRAAFKLMEPEGRVSQAMSRRLLEACPNVSNDR